MKYFFTIFFYNVIRNKSYACFCIFGTALTFIFVTFLIHLGAVMQGDYPPSSKARSIITLSSFENSKGEFAGKLSESEQRLLLEQIGGYESYATYLGSESITGAAINGNYFTTTINFVSAGFWEIYDFDFISGCPFSEEDCIGKKRCVVISRNLSLSRFHTVHSIGKKIEMDKDEYEVIGVVDNFSLFSSPTAATEMWFPIVLNNLWEYLPALSILFTEKTDMEQMKAKIAGLVRKIFENKNSKTVINTNTVLTNKEKNQKTVSKLNNLSFGLLIFLVLLIPAMNIISLNMSSSRNRATEIAVRKAYGAGKTGLFYLLLFDNLLLSLAGVITGILLTKPFVSLIQNVFFAEVPMLAGSSLIPDADMFLIITVIMPLMFLFLLMFAGLPAWLTAKSNIAETLKGGIQ